MTSEIHQNCYLDFINWFIFNGTKSIVSLILVILKHKKKDILIVENDEDAIYAILNKSSVFGDFCEITRDAENFDLSDEVFDSLIKVENLNNLTVFLTNQGQLDYKIDGVQAP